MLRRWLLCLFFLFVSLSLTSIAAAAELRGRLTGLPGASIRVACKGFDRSVAVGHDGAFTVSGLPLGRDCSFTVIKDGARSAPIPFSTSRSVTIYNAQLKQLRGRILVIRK